MIMKARVWVGPRWLEDKVGSFVRSNSSIEASGLYVLSITSVMPPVHPRQENPRQHESYDVDGNTKINKKLIT